MIADQVGPGSWNQGSKPGDEVGRCEEDVGGAVAEGMLEFVHDLASRVGGESFQAEGGAGDVAA